MTYNLKFDKLYSYSMDKEGIAIPVKLKLGAKETYFEAFVDTGASYCIFERMFGEDLGIDIESGYKRKIRTVTGVFFAYGHEVTLSVLDYELDSVVYFAENEDFGRNVLGRTGWLNRLSIAIIDYDGQIYVSRYDDEV